MDGNFRLSSLLIVSLLALLVPLLVSRSRRIRIPIVVGEILVGVIVGKSGFDIIHSSEWLSFLQFFGLAYLMFVSGLEVDFQALRPSSANSAAGMAERWLFSAPAFAIISCLITFGLSIAFSTVLFHHHMIRSPLLFALIITTTSLTVVVPVLKEYNVIDHAFGQLLLAAAVFADFVTMLLISVAASLFKGGFSPSVLLVFILPLILLGLYWLFLRFSRFHTLRGLADGTAQLGIRASLALMVVFIVLSQSLGVQVILGTFLAGMLVGLVNRRERSDITHKLDAIGFGFLIPIFFVMVGVDFNISALIGDPRALALLPMLFAATYLFKGLPLLLLRLRHPWRRTFAGAFLLTTQMSVTVAAAAVGLKIGAISPGVDTAIILVAMLTSVISPVLFGKLLPRDLQLADKPFVIAGNATGAQLLVQQMRDRGERVEWYAEGAPTSAFAGGPLRAFVAYGDDDAQNIVWAETAAKSGVQPVVCLLRNLTVYQEHSAREQFLAVNPQLSSVTLVDQLMHYPIATSLLQAPASLQIQEIKLTNRALQSSRLADLKLPGTLLILSISRSGLQIVPHGETTLQAGDTLVVIGLREDIGDFRRTAGGLSSHYDYPTPG